MPSSTSGFRSKRRTLRRDVTHDDQPGDLTLLYSPCRAELIFTLSCRIVRNVQQVFRFSMSDRDFHLPPGSRFALSFLSGGPRGALF
jgi:hypothetical protein